MITSATLQLIAIITMLIDHIGFYWCDNNLTMRLIGRFAMPLFCFMLAEGFLHTKGKRWAYFGRLLIFAFISQLPYDLLHQATSTAAPSLNVMFTLATGFAVMALIESRSWSMICLPILFMAAEYLNMDYGAYGIVMIAGFYLASKLFQKEKYRIWRWATYIALLFTSTAAYALTEGKPAQLFAIVAIIPIVFYNGKLGKRLPKWFGYIFYPAHLAIIYLVRSLILL